MGHNPENARESAPFLKYLTGRKGFQKWIRIETMEDNPQNVNICQGEYLFTSAVKKKKFCFQLMNNFWEKLRSKINFYLTWILITLLST